MKHWIGDNIDALAGVIEAIRMDDLLHFSYLIGGVWYREAHLA